MSFPSKRIYNFLSYLWEDIRGFFILGLIAFVLSLVAVITAILVSMILKALFFVFGMTSLQSVIAGLFGVFLLFVTLSIVAWIRNAWKDSGKGSE